MRADYYSAREGASGRAGLTGVCMVLEYIVFYRRRVLIRKTEAIKASFSWYFRMIWDNCETVVQSLVA